MSKTGILSFLKNGTDYYPFGDKPTESFTITNSTFIPFERERNQVGRLVTEQIDNKINTQSKKQKELKKYTTIEQTTSLPYISPKLPTESNKSTKLKTEFDPNTHYLTLLTTQSNNMYDNSSIINLKQYTLNHNQVERGQQMTKNYKGIDHKYQLISKKTKNLLNQTPAVGIYNPHPLQQHLPKILIKSKPNQKYTTNEPAVDKPQTPPKKRTKNDDFEMIFAKEITQINREVEQEMKRNPNQHFFAQPFDVATTMNQDEADEMRYRMKVHFQSVKDSLTKMKNLINIKR